MTEQVILSVTGTQMDLGDDAATEIIVAAAYYYRNGKHFVVYDEPDPENGGTTGNTIKIADDRVDVIRRGAARVHMVFERDKQNMTCYHTPAGMMTMDVFTDDICTKDTGDMISTEIAYSLHMNDVFISNCRVQIKIMSKESASVQIG